MMYEILAVVLTIVASILGVIATFYLKFGSKDISFNPSLLIKNFNLMSGILLYGISNIIFILALKWADLSILSPLSAVGYIFINILSIKILNEKVTLFKWSGVLFILVGSILIGLSS